MVKHLTFIFVVILLLFFQMQDLAFELPHVKSITGPDSTSVNALREAPKNNDEQVTWYQMFTNIPSDYSSFFRNSFKTKEIPLIITVGALTGTLLLVDEQGWKYNYILFKKSKIDHNVANIAVNIGDGRYLFLAAALFAAPGIAFHNETAIKTGSNIVEAVITTGLFVQVLKRITGRESPAAATQRGGDWDFFPSIKQYQKNQPAYYAYPSGHLSTATAILTVIANNYPDEKWIKPVGYPLLGLLGISLVSKGMHWYSDLPLAYFLGYSFGNVIAPERKLPYQDDKKSSFTISPSINYNGVQLGMMYKF